MDPAGGVQSVAKNDVKVPSAALNFTYLHYSCTQSDIRLQVMGLGTVLSGSPRDRLLFAAREVYGRNLFANRGELLHVARVGKATLSKNFKSLEQLRECAFAPTERKVRKRPPDGRLDMLRFIPDSLRGMKLHRVRKAALVLLWQQYQAGSVFGLRVRRFVKSHLFVAGVSLFAGEGTKSHSAGGVELVNSDPTIIRIFLKFLNELGLEPRR